jgi:hypothetical protein
MDQIQTSFGLRGKNATGLKITMFSLSYMHQAQRQVKHIKYYQIYYPGLRRYTGVGVPIDQILTTHINVPGIEPTYASGKEVHELIYYI